MERRNFLKGLGLILAAPALVKFESIMPVKAMPSKETLDNLFYMEDGTSHYILEDGSPMVMHTDESAGMLYAVVTASRNPPDPLWIKKNNGKAFGADGKPTSLKIAVG